MESLQRKHEFQMELFRETGRVDDAKVDSMLMKVLQSRQGYLMGRLKSILAKRDDQETEAIRNKYIVMAQEAEAERAASKADKNETMQKNFDKMMRFIENY